MHFADFYHNHFSVPLLALDQFSKQMIWATIASGFSQNVRWTVMATNRSVEHGLMMNVVWTVRYFSLTKLKMTIIALRKLPDVRQKIVLM